MSEIFAEKESVFFIGGTGDQSGAADNNGGGCSKTWFDVNSWTDLMGTNGAPVHSTASASYTHSTTRIASTGIGTNSEAGMVAYISDGGVNITTGRYEITDIIDSNTIEVADIVATGDATGVTVRVGGALNTLQYALDNLDPALYSIWLYDNRYGTYKETPSSSIYLDTHDGDYTIDTHLYVIGFHSEPGDMDEGGAYYQSNYDAYINGVDSDKCVELYGNGGGLHILNWSVDNIVFQNFYFNSVDSTHYLIYMDSADYERLENCKFNDGKRAIYTVNATLGLTLISCLFTNISDFVVYNPFRGRLIDCITVIAAGQYGFRLPDGCHVDGCVFINGAYGIQGRGDGISVINCVFYNQTVAGISMELTDSVLTEYNNIYVPATVSAYGVYSQSGSIVYSDYSCAYCIAASSPLNSGHAWPVKGSHSIEQDPLFTDPDNGDFSLQSSSPCLETGKPTVEDGKTSMGEWQPDASESGSGLLVHPGMNGGCRG